VVRRADASIPKERDADGSLGPGGIAHWSFAGAARPAGSMPAASRWDDGPAAIPGAVIVAGYRRAAVIGVSASLGAIAFVALITIGVFFGVAFALLRQPGPWSPRPSAAGRPGNAVASVPQSRLPHHAGPVAKGGPAKGGPAKGGPAASGLAAGGLAVPKAADHPPVAAPAAAGSAPPLAAGPRVASPAPAAAPDVNGPNAKAAAAVARQSEQQLAVLVARGDALLRIRDIASARLFYERAADDGDGQAAFRVGATFDPIFLASLGLRAMHGDRARAVSWYRRAIALGATGAQPYLHRLETR